MSILRNLFCFAPVIFLASSLAAQSNSSVAEKLKIVPANVPVKILEEGTGGRLSPGLFWSPGLKKFVYFAGKAARKTKPHYDVEHFDLSEGRWTNAYPGGAPYKVLSGPTDAPVHGVQKGIFSLVDDKGVSRVPLVGNYYGSSAVLMARQYALDPSSGLFYALILNKLAVLDTKKSTWAFAASREKKAKLDLKNKAAWGISGFEGFSKGGVMHWGAFCLDPVNKEILSIGGSGMSKGGTPGTWIFSLSKKKWTHINTGTARIIKIREKLEKLKDRSWALLSHARSRFFITESPVEEKVKLSAVSATLA